jgi:hypothetical protein
MTVADYYKWLLNRQKQAAAKAPVAKKPEGGEAA